MPTLSELKDTLLKDGVASLTTSDTLSLREARGRLIEAAKRANVRVSLKRIGSEVTATKLSEEDGIAQRERDAIFRAANKIKQGLEVLKSGALETEGLREEIDDLEDIVRTLEEDARARVRGATS